MKTDLVQLLRILIAITMVSLTSAVNPATELGALMRFRSAIPELQLPWDVTKNHCIWLGIQCSNGVVVIISLSELNLTGTVPSSTTGVLKGLRRLFLDSNKLSGPLPRDIGDAPSLNIVRLESNEFTGSLPPSLGNLKHLIVFNVSNNPLEGEIPPNLQHWSRRAYIKTNLCGKPLRVCPAPPPSPSPPSPPPPPPSSPPPPPPDNANPIPSPTNGTGELLKIILPIVGIVALPLIGVLVRFLYKKYYDSSTIPNTNPSEVEMNQGSNTVASTNNEMFKEMTSAIALANAETLKADARARENESKANYLKAEADLARLHKSEREAKVEPDFVRMQELAREGNYLKFDVDSARVTELERDATSIEVDFGSARMRELENEAKKKVLEMTDTQSIFSSACLRPPRKFPGTAPPALPQDTWATNFDEESADNNSTTIDDHTSPERESKLACLA